jgi:hypothetical protein
MAREEDPMAGIEKDLFGEETSSQRTKRMFDTNGPFAAAQIIDLAANSASDSIRLRASQYVVDRVLGPTGKESQEDVLNEFLEGISKLAGQSAEGEPK